MPKNSNLRQPLWGSRQVIPGLALILAFVVLSRFFSNLLIADFMRSAERPTDFLSFIEAIFKPEEPPPPEDSGRKARPLVPSIAPLADKVPLDKVDFRAHDKKLIRTAADKMVIANYFAKKYDVEMLHMLGYIDIAIDAGGETRLDPLLLLAIISIESNFQPDVQSPVGAQGLMQIMPRIHAAKLKPYGGLPAAFDPEANIRVGALIIKQATALMGSLTGGLRFYVGAAQPDVPDGGFVNKVLGEYMKLISLLGGNPQSIAPAEDIKLDYSRPSTLDEDIDSDTPDKSAENTPGS